MTRLYPIYSFAYYQFNNELEKFMMLLIENIIGLFGRFITGKELRVFSQSKIIFYNKERRILPLKNLGFRFFLGFRFSVNVCPVVSCSFRSACRAEYFYQKTPVRLLFRCATDKENA